MNKKVKTHPIVVNLSKIMNDRGLRQNSFAAIDGFTPSKMTKILNGTQNLNFFEFSKIANFLNLREIDIITYPKIFTEKDISNNDVKVQLTVELKEHLRDNVLKMIFGNSNLEIINR